MMMIDIDKLGSATSPLKMGRRIFVVPGVDNPRAGDVVAVKALTESVTYGNLELPSGRLAKVNRGDTLLGVLGKRRALKGFVGDVPATLQSGDRLHLLNMGGVIGECKGHHSSLSDAIEVEVIGVASDDAGTPLNIADAALNVATKPQSSAPIVVVAGSCMNSGKTVAAIEIIKQASNAGLKVAGAKLTGIACLRDTLNMQDHGAFVTASFLDCGLPSTVDNDELPSVARTVFNHLNSFQPDLIVAELGDGIVGGYGVDSILNDQSFRDSISSFVFCASDYVGVIGGMTVLQQMGIDVDVVAGSVTDSKMGEDFVREHFGLAAGNARRDGERLYQLIETSIRREARLAA